jgi:putative flippase GtrA
MSSQTLHETRILTSYLTASILALLADASSYALLLGVHMPATYAAALSYTLGLEIHYLVSRRFILAKSATGHWTLRQSMAFLCTGIAGVLTTSGTVFVLTGIFAVHPGVAKAVAVGSSFIAVYTLRRSLIFRSCR